MKQQTPLKWYHDKIKSHFKDGDLLETLDFTYAIARSKEQEQITPELKAAVKLLKRHNKWRRGAEIEPTYPTELGLAIDTIVKYFERNKQTP